MQRNPHTNDSLRSIVKKHQLSLEQAIYRLAQAVGNRPPEREDISAFFQALISGDWDAYEEATAHESAELRKQDREILQLQEKLREQLDEDGQDLFVRYEAMLNSRMTSELDHAYLVGYQTAIRFLLMGILPTEAVLTHNSQNASEEGEDNYET